MSVDGFIDVERSLKALASAAGIEALWSSAASPRKSRREEAIASAAPRPS